MRSVINLNGVNFENDKFQIVKEQKNWLMFCILVVMILWIWNYLCKNYLY